METESKLKNLSTPIATVLAGAFIALAVYFGGQSEAPQKTQASQPPAGNTGTLQEMTALSPNDHIRGSADALIVVVEYSDFECPFCKSFHSTMQRIVEEYDGKVAWVYRHFPLDQLHSKADKEAEAAECAGELGGNDAFWNYADRLFEVTPSNNGLDSAELPNIAEYIGLDVPKFNTCLSSGKYAKHVEDETQNALKTGGQGTPWSIVVIKNGKKYPLSGAQPYENVKQLIEQALQEK